MEYEIWVRVYVQCLPFGRLRRAGIGRSGICRSGSIFFGDLLCRNPRAERRRYAAQPIYDCAGCALAFALPIVKTRSGHCQDVFGTVRGLGQLAELGAGDNKGEGPSTTSRRLNAKSFVGRFGATEVSYVGVKESHRKELQ